MRLRTVQGCSLAVAIAALSSSCASWSYRDATCYWIELVEAPELDVTGPRVTWGSYAPCTLDAPGHFVLRRAAYRVEFWNGEEWYPQLYVRAFESDGERLTLRSTQLFGAPTAQLRSTGISQTEAYDYFFRDAYTDEHVPLFERIEFTVLDTQGRELGRESLKVVGKSGGKYRAYY